MKRTAELVGCDLCGEESEHDKLNQLVVVFKDTHIPWLFVDRPEQDTIHVCSHCHAGIFEFIIEFLKIDDGESSKERLERLALLGAVFPNVLNWVDNTLTEAAKKAK